MRTELPTQGQIVEELADRAANQIDLGKPVAFDGALGELVRYHRFVLGMSASTTDDGTAFNYAELGGDGWRPSHQYWLMQYRRLADRAVNRIPDNDHFLTSLAHVPRKLLNLSHGLVASSAVTDAILDLFPSLTGSVENWVTRNLVRSDEQSAEKSRWTLAGSNAKALASTLRDMVGAWESLLTFPPAVGKLNRRRGLSDDQIWEGARQLWPFAWRHLLNTAYCLCIAAWNGDDTGTAIFREALARWPDNIRYQLPGPLHLRFPELLFPNLLELDWQSARKKASMVAFHHEPDIDPGALCALLLFQLHRDVLLLVASLLANWSLTEKTTGHGAVRSAAELLASRERPDIAFQDESGGLMFQFIRLWMAGERYRDGSYGARLDGAVAQLDNMTEKEVVSGRIYEPTTLNDRDGLLWADVAIAAAFFDPITHEALEKRIIQLTDVEDLLPKADYSLRDLLREIDRYLEAIDAKPSQILATIEQFGLQNPDERLDAIGKMLRSIHRIITSYRMRRLRERPVDPARLDARRAAVEAALLDPGNLDFFTSATIAPVDDSETGEICSYSIVTPKARLTDPPMGAEVINDIEVYADRAVSHANRNTIAVLLQHPSSTVKFTASPLDPSFWAAIRPLVAKIDSKPRLLVPVRFHSDLIDVVFRPEQSALAGLSVTTRTPRRADYLATIEGIDVHIGSTDNATAWLFSGNKLKRIAYGLVNDSQRVSVAYVNTGADPDTVDGKLEFHFRQILEWNPGPVIKIALPNETEPEPQTEAHPIARRTNPNRSAVRRLRRRRVVAARDSGK